MTTLVVPLDGSTFAERAVRTACSLAMRLDGADVMLLSCVSSADPEMDAAGRLHEIAESFAEVVSVRVRLLEDVDPVDAILAAVTEQSDGLLCMATHGRGGLRTAVLGSVATKVVCRSTWPLVLVGPNCAATLLPGERARAIVCSDGSRFSAGILPAAAQWCDRLQLEPWLVEVVTPDEDPESARRTPNLMVERAQGRLETFADRLPTTTPPRTMVLHGNPSRSISRHAEELPAAMIAMATHGRTGLTRLAMGSVAIETVRLAPCPLLIARPSSAAQACLDD